MGQRGRINASILGSEKITQQAMEAETQASRIEQQRTGKETRQPSFNCDMVYHTHSSVNVSSVWQQVQTSTRTIAVPYLTNTKALVKGEELIMSFVVKSEQRQKHKPTGM